MFWPKLQNYSPNFNPNSLLHNFFTCTEGQKKLYNLKIEYLFYISMFCNKKFNFNFNLILQHTLLSVLYTMIFKVLIWGKRLKHVNKAESIMPYFFFIVGYCFDTRTFRFYLYTRFILSIARTTMPQLAQHSRDQAIGMLQAGESVRGVARRFGCSRVAIYDLQRCFQGTGLTLDRQRSGRPRVRTANQDRRNRLNHIRDRFCSAAATAAETPGRANNRISAKTVMRRLREHGLRARRPYVGMVINDR